MSLIEVTDNNFKEEVLDCDKIVIADFWAEWCGPCKMMLPIFEEASKHMGDQFKFVKINVEEAGELAQKYGITSIPTVIVFENGEVKNTHIGLFQNQQKLKTWIEAV